MIHKYRRTMSNTTIKCIGGHIYYCMSENQAVISFISSALFFGAGIAVWYASKFKTTESIVLAVVLVIMSISSILLSAFLTDRVYLAMIQ